MTGLKGVAFEPGHWSWRGSGVGRVGFFGVYAEVGEGLLGLGGVEFSVADQAGGRGDDDGFGVDLKVAA